MILLGGLHLLVSAVPYPNLGGALQNLVLKMNYDIIQVH